MIVPHVLSPAREILWKIKKYLERLMILFRICAIFSFTNVFCSLSKMVFSGERYYNINRVMLIAIGLWPYQTSIVMQVQTVFFFGAYCFILLFQVFFDPFFFIRDTFFEWFFKLNIGILIFTLQFTTFLTATCNLEFILKELSYIFITILYIVNYNSYYFNSKEVSITCNFIFMVKSFYLRILILANKRHLRSNNCLNGR